MLEAAFQSAPQVSPVRILLATDAAAEGLNLQNHCYRLIHYLRFPGTQTAWSSETGVLTVMDRRASSQRAARGKSLSTTSLARATRSASWRHSLQALRTSTPISNS